MSAFNGKYHRIGVLAIVAALTVPVAGAQTRTPRVFRLDTQPAISGAYLGIQMEDVTAGNMAGLKLAGERGVIVRTVEKGSPAEAARLQENDVILEYCGIPVISAAQFSRLVNETPPNRTVDLVVSRDGKKMNVSAKLGKRDDLPAGDFGDLSRLFSFQGPEGRSFQFRVPPEGMRVMPTPRRDEKPRLGVTAQPLTDQMAEYLGVTGKTGAMITAVDPGSPAASKLKAGDVIVGADARRVTGPEDLNRIVQDKNGGKLDLKVIRDKKEISVTIELPAGGGPIKL